MLFTHNPDGITETLYARCEISNTLNLNGTSVWATAPRLLNAPVSAVAGRTFRKSEGDGDGDGDGDAERDDGAAAEDAAAAAVAAAVEDSC